MDGMDIPAAGFTLLFGSTVIALALARHALYMAMSVVCAAFLVAVMQISANLHEYSCRRCCARARAALAGSSTRMNNMPHGLCMFGADGGLAVRIIVLAR